MVLDSCLMLTGLVCLDQWSHDGGEGVSEDKVEWWSCAVGGNVN